MYTYVSRKGCSLCTEQEKLIGSLGLRYVVVDIDLDGGLQRAYGDMVPVLLLDGRVLIWGRFDREELTRAILALEEGGS